MNLPKDPKKPFVVNGIRFANRNEYDLRVKEDAHKLAVLLYDIYKEKKNRQSH